MGDTKRFFEIDVASTHENHLVDTYWTIEDDGNFKVSPAPFPCSIIIFRPPLDERM